MRTTRPECRDAISYALISVAGKTGEEVDRGARKPGPMFLKMDHEITVKRRAQEEEDESKRSAATSSSPSSSPSPPSHDQEQDVPRRRQRESSRPAHRRQSADSPDVTGKPAAILRLTSSVLAGSFTSSSFLHLITSSFLLHLQRRQGNLGEEAHRGGVDNLPLKFHTLTASRS